MKRRTKTETEYSQFHLRLPTELLDWVKIEADSNCRSITAEMRAALKSWREKHNGSDLSNNMDQERFREAAEEMAKTIKYLIAELGPTNTLDEFEVSCLYFSAFMMKRYADDVLSADLK